MPTRSSTAAAVTGIGLVTAAGIGTRATWERVVSGRPTAARDPELAGMPVDFDCRVADFDPDASLGRRRAWRLDRAVQFALVAAAEALADAGLDPDTWDGDRVGVVIGTAFGGSGTLERQQGNLLTGGPEEVSPMLIPMATVNMVAGHLGMEHHARGPNFVVSTACASGSTAIGTARGLLTSGLCDIVITGGTEASLNRTIISGFARMGALSRRVDAPERASRPFDTDRDGFVAAEGAAVLVLERPEHAAARGARGHATIRGFGASADAHHPTAPQPGGEGMIRAVRAALTDAGISATEVQHVNAHGTGTQLNDRTEARAFDQLFGDRSSVTSTKGVTGHALGAAGAIETALSVLAVEHGIAPPTAKLSTLDPAVRVDVVAGAARHQRIDVAVNNSTGFGGQNAALVICAE